MKSAKLFQNPAQMEPLLPKESQSLTELALQVLQKSATLFGRLHPTTKQSLMDLLRVINSYYSNRIEGHETRPADIERAMKGNYAKDPSKRRLQLESRIHIELQQSMEARLKKEPNLNVATPEFLSWLHHGFYERLPKEFKIIKNPKTGRSLRVVPGKWRQVEITVGQHLAPHYQKIPLFLDRFSEFYSPTRFQGTTRLLAAAASHHRFTWIHPFLDGNGRVVRLFTDAYLYTIPILGYGLWSLIRGFARHLQDYRNALAWADAPRRNDYDGRGALSAEGLNNFCKFFLDTSLDQIDYMDQLLQLDSLLERIRAYIEMRKSKLLPPIKRNYPTIKSQAAHILEHTLLRGEISRGEALRVTGLSERSARKILKQLLTEGLLKTSSPKGPVQFCFPTFFAEYLFPKLYF